MYILRIYVVTSTVTTYALIKLSAHEWNHYMHMPRFLIFTFEQAIIPIYVHTYLQTKLQSFIE